MSMSRNLYGVFDSVQQKYISFFFESNDDAAKRSFIMSYTRDEKFAELFGLDCVMIYLGSIDVVTGKFTKDDQRLLMSAKEAFDFISNSKGSVSCV